METTTRDRRKSNRVQTEEVIFHLVPEGSDRAVLRNISRAGLMCQSDCPIAEMTPVDIVIDLPALPEEKDVRYAFRAKGAVVRCVPSVRTTSLRRYEVAVYFTEVEEVHRETLERYLAVRRHQKAD